VPACNLHTQDAKEELKFKANLGMKEPISNKQKKPNITTTTTKSRYTGNTIRGKPMPIFLSIFP
jgi:uncharacterized protein YgiM (DUF1202 family)